MSISTDEDTFTIITEDFEIPCDANVDWCQPAKFSAIKKCCGDTIFLCPPCVSWFASKKVELAWSSCTECRAVFPLGGPLLGLFILNPL